jgi:hypothetical protein
MEPYGPNHRFKANRRYLDGVRRFAYGHSYRGVPNEKGDVIGGLSSAPSMGSAWKPKKYRADANYLWENAHTMYESHNTKNLY